MDVPQKLWRMTEAASILNLFPGQLGELLQKTTPQAIVRAQQFLPFIFWRWYFLRMEIEGSVTPYEYLNMLRFEEYWPEDGQFFPNADISSVGDKLKVDISVDYISFDEQPFVVDILNIMQEKVLTYPFQDKKYEKDLRLLAEKLKEKNISPIDIKTHIIWLARQYFKETLSSWYQKDEVVKNAFSFKEWLDFWYHIVDKVEKEKYYNTIELLDDFVVCVREIIPDYGLTNDQLKDYEENYKIDDRFMVTYHFWMNSVYYVFVPMSLYWHLFSLVFGERENFSEDVSGLLSSYYEEPIPLYSPCSYVSLTPFGRKVFVCP